MFALSIPFWIFGAVAPDLSGYLPMNLPVSSLMFLCPLVAALILTYREKGRSGVWELLRRTFDARRVKRGRWYVPLVFLMPVVLLLEYGLMVWAGRPLPSPEIAFAAIPVLFVVFFVAAAGEELGWMGYAAERELSRWSAWKASIAMGSIWAVWHVIPFFQTGHGATWVLWQCVVTVLLRVLIFWFYGNMGKSILAAIVFHDMVNLGVTLFPADGSHYDPFVTSLLLAIVVAGVVFGWGPKTLARHRGLARKDGERFPKTA
ncbi:hypothetical protein GCM10012289_70810 [Nonomuraea cavernae]|uniref:CAAX prenyl protease 2/Lysostaphin resistance protein A-like domain-containing protein n=1 Tax=Nonomuraea cavernae TaxID=2045107 RepID=A0A917ZGP4_9ACTN|nr:hypothetical protein GCM10012289_70810 [Nonomuraea cavernae]